MFRPEPLIRFVFAQFDFIAGDVSQSREQEDRNQKISQAQPMLIGGPRANVL
jgi:hypothetical protein